MNAVDKFPRIFIRMLKPLDWLLHLRAVHATIEVMAQLGRS